MAPGPVISVSNKTVESNVSVFSAKEVPQRYLWEEDLRDAVFTRKQSFQLRETQGALREESLPIIDLLKLLTATATERKKLAEAVCRAAENWGFFQIINHGVPEEVISEMEAHGRDFFSRVPLEHKENAVEKDPKKHIYYHGYGGTFQYLNARVPWLEYLGECHSPVNGAESLFKRVWPATGNPKFCKAAHRYCTALVNLGRQLLELLAEGIDLSPDFFSKHFSDESGYQAHWRFNHYPACPEPNKTLGLGPHTDPCGMTIVRQDNVGGFQLRRWGQWYDAKPLERSFLVNIGDCLQAWSNGRFKSVLHRALVNNEADRLSIVFPFSPPADFNVAVPSSLIDDSHPLQFPGPVEWHHLAVIKGSHVKKEALTSTFGLKL